MTEQEATELIATELELPVKNKYGRWTTLDGELLDLFHDSNHARMVKDRIGKKELWQLYIEKLNNRLGLFSIKDDGMKYVQEVDGGWSDYAAWLFNNAPDADCMWAVVDVILEGEK